MKTSKKLLPWNHSWAFPSELKPIFFGLWVVLNQSITCSLPAGRGTGFSVLVKRLFGFQHLRKSIFIILISIFFADVFSCRSNNSSRKNCVRYVLSSAPENRPPRDEAKTVISLDCHQGLEYACCLQSAVASATRSPANLKYKFQMVEIPAPLYFSAVTLIFAINFSGRRLPKFSVGSKQKKH